MNMKQNRRIKALEKELLMLQKQEDKLAKAAQKAKPFGWKMEIEERIPKKVYNGLESAFCKGFAVVFARGRSLIEKSYNKEDILADHSIRDFAVQIKGGRKELKQMRKSASQSDFLNLAVTTLEGVALGALGVGMPDIALFITTLLKGVYETALNYGFDYETGYEQLLILKMMEAALSSGENWRRLNQEVDTLLLAEPGPVTEDALHIQMQQTASVFAMDMLLLKFIQGIPVVGILGGAANPVYYHKVLQYVQLKYRKRYLLRLRKRPVRK